jgi:predicted RNase H-like HicB family nuclease
MAGAMTRYVGLAERDENGTWVGSVAGLPGAITEAERLADIQANLAEAIWALTDEPTDPGDVTVTVALADVADAARELDRAS